MKKNSSHKFIRFGGLSKMDQKNRYGQDTFHAPPRKKGIYAFPEGTVDKFLLGATNSPNNPSNKSYWLKDEDGNRIIDGDFYTDIWDEKICSYTIKKKYLPLVKKHKIKSKDIFSHNINENDSDDVENIWYICVLKKPRTFEYDGEIWCHLGAQLRPEHIIEENGSWVKVSMDDYNYALKKEYHTLKKDMVKIFGIQWKEKNPFNFYCKDHLEVFIEKIN